MKLKPIFSVRKGVFKMKLFNPILIAATTVLSISSALSHWWARMAKPKRFVFGAANTNTASAAIIAALMLAPIAVFAEQRKPLDDPWASLTANTTGFITESDRRTPSVVDNGSADLMDRLCAQATRNSETNCPSSLKGGSDFPSPTDDISAGLPHLRLNIILQEMHNVVVSGSGVDSLGDFEEPWARFKIESSAADDSIPAPTDPASGLPVPAPGDTFDGIPNANGLYQGIIENGCVGTPATFDLTLDSSVFRITAVDVDDVFGEVHLVDEVEGFGYYNFEYTIRATDEDGNVSDFVFSGDADSYCTSQSAF